MKRFLLCIAGVQTATTELSTGKVIVTGTMNAEKLVDYVYRRTKKQAKIVPQPEPEPEKKEEKKEEEKPAAEEPKPEEAKPEEKKEENSEKKEEDQKATEEEPKKQEAGENPEKNENKEEAKKEEGGDQNIEVISSIDDEGMKRMMYYYQPLYVIERIPPPQLFSDENPNACSIS